MAEKIIGSCITDLFIETLLLFYCIKITNKPYFSLVYRGKETDDGIATKNSSGLSRRADQNVSYLFLLNGDSNVGLATPFF